MFLSDVPQEDPTLKITAQKIAPGEMIKAECRSPKSYPAMNITWFINDEEVSY